jgi:hypothetical protein
MEKETFFRTPGNFVQKGIFTFSLVFKELRSNLTPALIPCWTSEKKCPTSVFYVYEIEDILRPDGYS